MSVRRPCQSKMGNVLHSVLGPSHAAEARPRLDHWSLVAVIACACMLTLTSVAVTELEMGKTGISYLQLFLAPAVAVLTFATSIKMRNDPVRARPPRSLVVATVAFLLLLLLAALSLPLVNHPASVQYGVPSATVPVPLVYLASPLVTAGLTCLLAVLAVNLAPPEHLFRILWWFAVISAAATPVALIWNAIHEDLFGRLETRLGGAAVIHLVFLLGISVCLGAVFKGHRRVLSSLAALAHLLWFIASGARAGLISLAVFLLLMGIPPLVNSVRRHPARLPFVAAATMAALTVFLFAARYVLGNRGVDITGGGRVDTWSYGLHQAFSSLPNLVFGTGYGVLWPWFAFDAQALPQPGAHGTKQMPSGITLSHAHNLYVAVFSEQGLIGLGLLLTTLGVVCWAWWRARGVVERTMASGLVATLPSFFFDTYLIKNFPVSFVWWAVLAALLMMIGKRRSGDGEQRSKAQRRPRVLKIGSH